jgi:poly-gamma-glutamate synthesis protein (capsule biosynthesis protein)
MSFKRGASSIAASLLLLALTGITPMGEASPKPTADLSAYPWVYLRDGQALHPGEQVVELIAVGDVMLGRGVAGEDNPFAGAPWLRGADMTLGNLECAIAPGGVSLSGLSNAPSPQKPYLLVAPASAVGQLNQAGFDILGLANNHALDRGLEGLADTGAALQKAGMLPLGAAPEPDQVYEPLVRSVGGQKLAFLAFNAVPSPRGQEWNGEVRDAAPGSGWALAGWDRDRAVAAVQSARARAGAVIVSVHWGYEYDLRVDPAQREIALELIQAGASLIVGHHPHVVQTIEHLTTNGEAEGALVAYSLGNFVFDQGFEGTGQGLALRAFFDRQGLRAVQALPVRAGPRPALMAPDESSSLLERVAPQPKGRAWRCSGQDCVPTALPSSNHAGFFGSIESDLTGNGAPERVALESGSVRIESANLPRWESPADWQVIDLAAGDPNRDGRQELLIALQKPDPSGVLLSHPFILGYRGGEFRVIWGGSAASDPILEVELGDLDGDGLQELAVLEELHDGKGQAVSLWRWNGWGFSLVWRSAPGRYDNLRLILGNEGKKVLIVVDEANAGGTD